MKEKKRFALMGLTALTGVAIMTACSGDEQVAGPNYDPATDEVATNLVFNIATGNTPSTRMTSAATQATEDDEFRGIDHAVLFAYKGNTDGKHLAAAATMDKRYDLAQLLAASTIDKDNSRRVIETSLPVNTNTLLFYGKAIEGTTSGNNYKAFDMFGRLDDYTVPEDMDLTKVNFELAQRLTGDNLNIYRKVESLLSGALTCIMNTNLSGSNHVAIAADDAPVTGINPYGFDVAAADYPELSWETYANADGRSPVETSHALYPLEQKLADVYREMTNISQNSGELRAGSAHAIEAMIHDLWSNINEVRCATPLNVPEAVAKYLAGRISLRLTSYFGFSSLPTDGHAPEGVGLRSVSDMTAALAADEWPATADAKPTDFSGITADLLHNFPYSFWLPAGASHLTFDNTKKQFAYVKDFNTSAMGDEAAQTIESYYFPPELLYFGNSPVRVSSQEMKTNNYPNGVANWDNEDNWSSTLWSTSHVTTNTNSVAMKNDINYGTSLLKTTVRYATTQLKDNNHAIQVAKHGSIIGENDEPDHVITANATSFQLMGIIIGGQKKKVGWDFIPKATGNKVGIIYDPAIVSTTVPVTGASVPNYTLAFDNYINAPHQDKVYVALEFLNNSGEDFFGEHNLVRNQTRFYLIGELDPEKSGLTAIDWPEHHPLPPYNTDGSSIKVPRVFMQDYMTTADFVIGENSLKHAYLTVPDLRYSSITLGLSVDIKWSTGLNFEEVILGGE